MKNSLYVAKVIKNNDSQHKDKKKEGRIQIKIDFLMKGFEEDHLPWARPFLLGTGGNAEYGSSSIPEEGSYVWVFFLEPDILRQAYYIANVNLSDINPHEFFSKNVKSRVKSSSIYPNTKFNTYKNQITTFIDSSADNPELGFYHPKGTYVLIDKEGTVNLKGAKDIKIEDGNGNKLEKTDSGITVTDKNGNKVEMTSTGIKISGGKDLEITGTPDAPNGQGGFCAVPGGSCLFAGTTITTNKIKGLS